MKKLAPAVAFFSMCALAPNARGDDPGDAHDVEHASAAIHQLADEARERRVGFAVVGAATSVLLLPAGVVLATRSSNDVANIVGTGMIGSGSAALAVGVVDLFPSHVEHMAETFDRRRADRKSDAELLRVSYADWREAAASARKRRWFLGTAETVVGLASTAFGLGLMLANDGVFGFDRERQYRIGSISTGSGIPFLGLGLRTLLVRSAEERLWSMSAPFAEAPSVGFYLVPGGGGIAAGWTY